MREKKDDNHSEAVVAKEREVTHAEAVHGYSAGRLVTPREIPERARAQGGKRLVQPRRGRIPKASGGLPVTRELGAFG
eukprot:7919255-Pyramimonas_sp.AAC.1